MVNPTNILIISASGIGCTIMFTPTLRTIRSLFPSCRITFLSISESFAAPVSESNLIDELLIFDFPKDSLFKLETVLERLFFILNLRKRKFDYSFTVFPSNKWYFNVFAWLVGAKKRVTHGYATSSLTSLAFLQNLRIQADETIHDVDQNINLLKTLPSPPFHVPEKELFFQISKKDNELACEYLRTKRSSGKRVIGIHAGSSQDYSFEAKRWPLEKFAKLADMIQENLGAEVFFFFGPNEKSDINKLKELMKTAPNIVQLPIKLVAAIIKKCNVMISGDSGLMHIAVAMKTPLVAIFGPTNLSRTRPYTKDAEVIYDKDFNSVFNYPFKTTVAKIDPETAEKSFKKITVEMVFEAVQKKLKETRLE